MTPHDSSPAAATIRVRVLARDPALVARLQAAFADDAAIVLAAPDAAADVVIAEHTSGDASSLLVSPAEVPAPAASILPLPASVPPATLLAACRQAAEIAFLRREHRRLESLAGADPLTGIANRRALEAHFRLLQNQPSDARWHVAMFDIDQFKQINARLGHVRGDDVLRAVASALARPGTDNPLAEAAPFVARLAGDEFLLLLRGAAESFHQQVEQLRAAASAAATEAAHEPVTLAAGAATMPEAATLAALIDAADTPLRAAKRAGGAQTRSAS